MTCITVGELDLLSFFEIEPKRLDRDVPWPYNYYLYEVAQGNLALSFSVAPSVRDVRVLLKCEGELLYELNAVGVEDVRCHKDKGQEALAVVLNTHDSIWLRIKPKIVINHYAKERT